MARILVTGGGTGGHLFPALAVAKEFVGTGHEVLYVGSTAGLEARRPWTESFPRILLPVRGYLRGSWSSALAATAVVPRWLLAARGTLRRFRPDVVAGFGGYASAPSLLAARCQKIPYVLHESNARAGVVNRFFRSKATQVLLSFPSDRPDPPAGTQRDGLVTGTPVRFAIASLRRGGAFRRRCLRRFGLPEARSTLLIMPGSQGSRRLNELVLAGLDRWAEVPRLSLLWMTGERGSAPFESAARRAPLPCSVVPFIDRVDEAYGAADLFLGRAGSSTLAELACARLPAVLVPYPHAAGDHQRRNAERFARAGAAVVVDEREATPESLVEAARGVLPKRKLAMMSAAAGGLAHPRATQEIAEEILRVIGSIDRGAS